MLKKIIVLLFAAVNLFAQIHFINVKDLGAAGNGQTLDTKALQMAIDKCSLSGGTVLFPPGKYLTGSLELKNNVDIYLSNGAVILGSTNIKDYKEYTPGFASYNDSFLKHSLFYAENCSNISIHGEGVIDGQGSAYKVITRQKPDRYKNRPYIFRFVNCIGIKVKNLTLQNSAMWMQQYLGCEDLVISGIKVINHANQNNDMMDIDGCKNVIISDCIGDTDDDGITLKSTSPKITENVTITGCILSSHCNALKFGTESTGGFKNITVSNIVIKPSRYVTTIYGKPGGTSGITLATVDGGMLKGVIISNVRIDGSQVPICIRLGNRARKYTESAPEPGFGFVDDVMLSNITADNVDSIGCSITGIPGHPVKNISLSNIKINFAGGGSPADREKKMPELADSYPEGNMWGNLPAYGFYLRHAENIYLSDIHLTFNAPEQRPAILAEDIIGLTVISLKAAIGFDAEDFFVFRNVKNAVVSSCTPLNKINNFLLASGNESENIIIKDNYLMNVNSVFTVKDADKKIVSETGNIK